MNIVMEIALTVVAVGAAASIGAIAIAVVWGVVDFMKKRR